MITDFNNPKMHTTVDIRYNKWFGFTDDENLEGDAKKVLKQIEDKKYDNYLGRRKPAKIVHYGIAFCLKDCRILKGVNICVIKSL